MKTFLFLLSFSVVILCSFTQCRKCSETQQQTQFLTPEERNIIPYKTNDSVVFTCLSTNLSYSLKVLYRTDTFNRFYENGPASSENHYCGGNFYLSEVIVVQFVTYYCTIFQTMSDKFNQYFEKSLDIDFGIPNGNMVIGFNGNFKFDSDSIFNGREKIAGYYNSLQLGPRTFLKVYELESSASGHGNNEYFKYGYYSRQYGFVGFKTDLGNIWYLN